MKLKKYVEGLVSVVAPDLEEYRVGRHVEPAWAPVFYNPRMSLSRDIGVATVAAFTANAKNSPLIVEPLSATGVRGLRYLVEGAPHARLILNDIDPLAYQLMRINVRENHVSGRVAVLNTDARLVLDYLAMKGLKADIVDLDPFGSPAPFVEPAIRAVRNGGLLCATATDLPPLIGIYPDTCLRKYGSRSIRTEYSLEVGARILLAFIAREAGKFGRYIEPMLTQATDHYIRVCVRLRRGRRKAAKQLKQLMLVLHCRKCLYRSLALPSEVPSKCPVCGHSLEFAGPVWGEELWCPSFLDTVIREYKSRSYLSRRGLRILNLMREEIDAPPMYYRVDTLSGHYRLAEEPSPHFVVERLRQEGVKASLTHFDPKGFRCPLRPPEIVSHYF